MDNLILTLSFIKGIGKKNINYFIDNNKVQPNNIYDIIEIFTQLKNENKNIVIPTLESLKEATRIKDNVLSLSELHNINIVDKMDKDYPKNLKNIKNSPNILFYKGNYDAVINKKSITIIGSRKASEKGKELSYEVASYFANDGYTVISGLALGCDEYAHKGTLSQNGTTVAVLACGLNEIYPLKNTELAQQIISNNGCLLSEYPIGTKIYKHNFIERDRIQSGLSNATLVIETNLNSGSMHTVKYAKEQGRIIACYAIDTQGNNKLSNEEECFVIYNNNDIEILMDKIKTYKNNVNYQIKFDL